jgi:formylglycine-generating enzyme required for sulfatase activity
MVVLPGGTYIIGSDRESTEQPQLEVNIEYPFALSTHEVSYREYRMYCAEAGANCPSNPWGDEDLPVVGVSWEDAAGYVEWLSAKSSQTYRLPSEAEWEYAARAGSETLYPFGDNLLVTQARFSEPGKPATEPLPNSYRAINANRFRLYNMVGNVREWVADAWQDHHDQAIADGKPRSGGEQRVVRGGSYADDAWSLRSSAREKLRIGDKDSYTGFRVALTFDEKTGG